MAVAIWPSTVLVWLPVSMGRTGCAPVVPPKVVVGMALISEGWSAMLRSDEVGADGAAASVLGLGAGVLV